MTLINPDDQFRFGKIEKLIEKEVPKLAIPERLGKGPEYNPKSRGGGGRHGGRSGGHGGHGGHGGRGGRKPSRGGGGGNSSGGGGNRGKKPFNRNKSKQGS